ncbi:serine/threonine protein kinase [Hyalangium sp.]|uniref:serine/threonine protein kinase n=1 Tax=Hyalangium sp. TaxID=2028555 RepID=UPI002D762EA2|nr:discoidin domain-containing protein [Hyalangium sp.]HYH98344.1 discoidin domain-containing protein [Hyalangium sp.]
MAGPLPSAGSCPGCAKAASGERCTHCGVAVRVGPYRVRTVLGQRGAARTYLAEDVDGLVVLKELSFSTEPAAATLQAFHQEARQLQSLTHPRIPRYLDMLQLGLGADTRLYLAQEFIEGTPLQTELSGRHCTELEARELARQVLDILRYLQSRSPQVFHGDLKPANFIRRSDGALFLVDFGAAWVRGGASPEASRYTPPDQAHGELDASTDLFGLGVTLVDTLSWEPEWKRQKLTVAEDLASRVDVAPNFREFLGRLTSVDPALRFATASEALRELELPEQAPQPLRRRLWPVALGAGAAVLIFGAGFVTGRLTSLARFAEHSNPEEHHHDHRARARLPPAPPQTPPPSHRSRPGPLHPPDTLDASNSDETLIQVKEQWAPDHKHQNCEFAGYATASSSGHLDTGEPAAAFDRTPGTSWSSNQSNGAWLQVDLGRNYTLHGMVLDWGWDTRYGPTATSTVTTSLDGRTWSHLHTVTNSPQDNSLSRRVWFPQRVARYVRFAAYEWHGGLAQVRAFELYGPECPLRPERSSENIRDMTNRAAVEL